MMWLALVFVLTFGASACLSVVVARAARARGIVDAPDGLRKTHKHPVPLLGGTAIFVVVCFAVLMSLLFGDTLTSGLVDVPRYSGFLVGGAILMIGGAIDDRYRLPPHLSFIAPVLAALCVVFGGVGIEKLTNPLGGVVFIPELVSDVLVFCWLVTMMYTTKLLDGLDGLSAGVSLIGLLAVLALSLTVTYFQPDVSLLATLCAGAVAGFLCLNLPQAKLYLGEGGSTFVGYTLGVLAVISGGKLAVALLVMGIPLLDVLSVMVRRVKTGGARSIVRGDRRHLHHKLMDAGFSKRGILALYWGVALVFGASALVLQSGQKLAAFAVLGCILFAIIIGLWVLDRRKSLG